MAEHNVNTVKAQIQSLINLANETTGNTDTNLTDGVNALVSGYGQGGSGGIEEGYDVTFYDENGEELAFYSVKQGHSVDAPNYSCIAWLMADGTSVSFPYFPTSDVSLYANNDTYADALYEHYGVDKGVYPYLAIRYTEDSTNAYVPRSMGIYFAKTVSNLTLETVKFNTFGNPSFNFDYNDIGSCVEQIIAKNYTVSQTSSSITLEDAYDDSIKTVYFTNFDLSVSNSPVYRLDGVEEKLPYDGLSNGYDVMFYDENNEGLAFYSIKQGHAINPPVYVVKNWLDKNGAIIDFPYMPTSDVIIYANNNTYAKQLYNYYGIDSGEYPYLWLLIMSGPTAMLVFGKSQSSGTLYDVLQSTQRSVSISDFTNLDIVVSAVTSKITLSDLQSKTSVGIWEDNSYRHYVNFNDYNIGAGTVYDLNT